MTNINWHQRLKETELTIYNFIDGNRLECKGSKAISKHSPRDGKLLYQFNCGEESEVNLAVASARKAFNDGRWSQQSVHQRKAILNKLADLLESHAETFALYECLDVGKPITKSLNDDVPRAIRSLRGSAEKADKLLSTSGSDGNNLSYQIRKPIGVVGGIIGWNYPLALAASKIGPALAMGNSLVLKPSEFTSLSACRLAELAMEAGLPPGVLNVVHGKGSSVGAAMASHNDIDLLTFVGSTATGKQIMSAAGLSNLKRVILECGGKSPYLVFDDCPSDLNAIAEDIVSTAFPNQGALCVAGTRLVIHESIKKKLLPLIIEHCSAIKPQDPLDPNTTFGALVNEAHLNKVLAYIESGEQEGATRICGGNRVLSDSGGFYLEPTIFDNVQSHHKIAREEIFGPVLSMQTFADENEAIAIANNSCFGLAAYVATENLGRTLRLGQSLNAGLVIVHGSTTSTSGIVDLGMEAHRESGFGFEGGMAGLSAYSVSTSMHVLV
ncbi:aldehyde dehydrogenase family protein [bacterium AH-315-K03]|nr:aldehyde dehydrogenase family protein [bacterium AH-315-K03]